jgi:hypothetical protein
MKKDLTKKLTTAFALLVLAALPAAGQGVYRCGNTYSQQPCAGGSPVDAAAAAPDAKERAAAAREETQREAKAADAMEKARLKEEARPAPAYIPPPKVQPVAADEKPVITKPKKPAYFTAVAPGTKPAAKKAKPKSKKASAPA